MINLIILSFLIPLFFYKLGQSSLVSWDEAWYAGISRNILNSGNFLHLIDNGELFADKPPGGIWITAVFFKLFGISNFTARLGSALCGVLSLYFIYKLGSKLFNRLVGLCCSVALVSSFWFLYRARSGNLDIPLTLFYILTVYLAVLSIEKKKYFIPFVLCFGYLGLIKGVVFMLVLVPVLIIIFWNNKLYKLKDLSLFLILGFGIFGSWIALQALINPEQAVYHFTHSLRNSSLDNEYISNIKLFKEYLHNGIGKWFWPGILGIVSSLFLRQKRFLLLSIFFVFYSLPFIFSPLVGIWHLIPLYPFMVLAFFGVVYHLGKMMLLNNVILGASLLFFAFYISFLQIRAAWYQFIDIPAFISDEEILSKEAGRNKGKFYIDGDFLPAAAFYSNKIVTKSLRQDIKKIFSSNEDFLLITNQWKLEHEKIDSSSYKILQTDRDRVLIQYIH